jgi:hypothetical protein
MFAELPYESTLPKGQAVTYTYDSNTILQLTSVSALENTIKDTLSKYGSIKVSRPFGSSHFIVTIVPNTNYSQKLFRNGIESSLDKNGIKDFRFLESEGGTVSSVPGGLVAATGDVLSSTTSGVSSILWRGVKPLLPWVIVGVLGYVGFQMYMAKTMSGLAGIKTNPRKRKRRS